ncbi:flagellar basal body-associated protein FliL [Nitrobacter sp. TKz-YC02]|uniref:flagellar basal body-associated protein FliL n=1 Tax=Nitrobacter sp. TKz-YC02 TaxID=3398704 RepID=UPI003CFBB49F
MAENDQAEKAADRDAPPAKKRFKLIVAVGAVLLILVTGGSIWFFLFRHHDGVQLAEAPPPKPPSFVDIPDMLVNLVGAPGERVQYLKVKVVLEVKEEPQVEKIKPALPRVTDLFQTYMRELRPSDLNGSAGLFRLKEELTKRVNAVISPDHVNAVLFKEVVIQ